MLTKATFKILSWDEEPFDEPDDGPKLTRAHIRKSFHGDLTGTGNLMYLMTHFQDGNATFLGFEKVVGALHGRSGSFVLQTHRRLRRTNGHRPIRGRPRLRHQPAHRPLRRRHLLRRAPPNNTT